MCIRSLVCSIKRLLVLISSPRSFRLGISLLLSRWVSLLFMRLLSQDSIFFFFFKCMYVWLCRFGILLDKRGSRVLVLRFTEAQIAVPLFMMSTSPSPLTPSKLGMRSFLSRFFGMLLCYISRLFSLFVMMNTLNIWSFC